MEITKYDNEMLKIMRDPVLWADAHLKVNPKDAGPRWYQEQILRHPHNRIVLRCGRRVGKCIAETERVINSQTGEYKTVGELFEQKETEIDIFTLNDKFKNTKSKTFYIEDNGVKPVYKVSTKIGYEVNLTKNHPLLTVNGWKNVEDIKVGDYIATPKKIEVFGNVVKDEKEIEMLAYIIGCGKIKQNMLSIEIKQDEMLKRISELSKELHFKLIQKSPKTYFILEKNDYYKKILLESKGRIPQEVYTYNKETLAKFLAYFFDIRGWVRKTKFGEFGFGSYNKDFVRDIKHLLLRFGIITNLCTKIIGKNEYYQVLIHKVNYLYIFLTEIGNKYGRRDYSFINKTPETMIGKQESIPKDVWKYIEKTRVKKKLTKREVAGNKDRRLKMNNGVTEEMLERFATNMNDDFLHYLANSDILWEEVISIEFIKEMQTYDVFVPETHNLVIEDIFVHNTWTMCAHMLWVAFTGNGGTMPSGATCVVATPYDNQARLIFDQLTQFINNNDVLRDSVESMTKNPYYIKLKNGGTIKLFTAGTKSGSEGGALRGQKADWLYMDKQLCPFMW